MQVRIKEITIKKRIRKDLGHVSHLAESLKKNGLLSPILLNKNYELIAGHRRLEAAKLLNWKTIPAKILDKPGKVDKLELEIEENIQRKELSPDELADAYTLLKELKNKTIFQRFFGWLKKVLKALVSIFTGRKK